MIPINQPVIIMESNSSVFFWLAQLYTSYLFGDALAHGLMEWWVSAVFFARNGEQ